MLRERVDRHISPKPKTCFSLYGANSSFLSLSLKLSHIPPIPNNLHNHKFTPFNEASNS
ncbi:hypothetical protein HanRHA438_Chr13g0614631 [Helianthus annuus]|uniref:Uncharacterized protein n=1 Tax=Helianthus annuus TaxID=4232 RepID=A0A9K3EKL9_HELAN|nr:hypothetical protein HanXRQr2_Chr13g0604151 [Helianthus annuus]KAJ0478027.1 hypothetical protein HanHA300_Chr13g0495541 [Helianthus annuus]KAJ0482652.1 hypothetical protein HanIR_Chr13g0656301 [Helianthus annuus]KAJ0498886.1 hypothetical protein HanHA89_Chr13g0527991 [Helianthus annuus]KAJ0664901.1 hypothetical protein HanLR1_Chr13g0498021 [Helianthus annuus]